MNPADHGVRRAFVKWYLERHAQDAEFFKKIIFSGEAYFQLNGRVNKHDCRIWGSQYLTNQLLSESLTNAKGVRV